MKWTSPALAVLACAGLALSVSAAAFAQICEAEPASEAKDGLERGNLLSEQGDAAGAHQAYGETASAARERGDGRLAALADASAGRASVESGDFTRAEAELEQALAEARELPDAAVRARILIHIGVSYGALASADPGTRSRTLLLASSTFAEAEEAADIAGDRRLRSYALGHRGGLYEEAGRTREAVELTRRAVFAAQEADAPDSLYRWQWQLGRLKRRSGDGEGALRAYREAVRTLDRLRQSVALETGQSRAAFRAQVEPVYVELVDQLLRRTESVDGSAQVQRLLAEARDTLETWKAAELRDYFRDGCLDDRRKATPDDIPGTVALYPIALPDRLELIVSARGRLSRFTSPVSRETLIAEVRKFRRQLERRITFRYIAHAQQLYDWLIRPLEELLEAEQPDTLVFVPDGALRTVPLSALRDRESGSYLIEQYPVAITPGLTLTDPRSIDRTDVELLAAGLTESVQGFPPLPGVGPEIEAVHGTFPGEQMLDKAFGIKRFESSMTNQHFGIVHIASHAEFSRESADSFLLAYDGKVSMDRLAAMIRATQFRGDHSLELLTLSACQTAEGDERAALGLAGLAVKSGARSALATLWSVNDEASAELVIEFYAQLAKPGLSRAEALRRAQLKMLALPDFRHAAYWAPYLLINSWL